MQQIFDASVTLFTFTQVELCSSQNKSRVDFIYALENLAAEGVVSALRFPERN